MILKAFTKKSEIMQKMLLDFFEKLPDYFCLSDFFAGMKYIFQKPYFGRSILTPMTQKEYNKNLRWESDIMENVIFCVDGLATCMVARSSEYLWKPNNDQGKAAVQFLSIDKVSDQWGQSLDLRTHNEIVKQIKEWYNSDPPPKLHENTLRFS